MKITTQIKELPTSNNKVTTDILSIFPSERKKLQNHSDGAVEFAAPKSFDYHYEIAQKVALAINQYIIDNNLAVKEAFEACKMIHGNELYIKIFSPEVGVSKEWASLLSDVAIELIMNGFDNITVDIGYNPPKNLSELASTMECLNSHREEILKINKKLGQRTTLHVVGPTTTGVIALKGTLKHPVVSSPPEPQDYQNQYYKIVASDISESSVKGIPYFFGDKNSKGKAEILYYEDKEIVNVLKQFYFEHRDYKLNISEKIRSDNNGLMKIITSIKPTEVPQGPGKSKEAQEDQAEIEFPV